jgi:hypothetical protein
MSDFKHKRKRRCVVSNMMPWDPFAMSTHNRHFICVEQVPAPTNYDESLEATWRRWQRGRQRCAWSRQASRLFGWRHWR